MQVGFNPNVSFKNDTATQCVCGCNSQQQYQALRNDLMDEINKPPKKNFKEKIAAIPKFFKAAGEIIKGTFKGLFYGAITGLALFAGGLAITKGFKADKAVKAAINAGEKLKKPLLSQKAKTYAVAGTGAGLVAAYNFIKGKMLANNKSASVDHYFGMQTGHNRR